jgi:general secretion pathway protein G
MNAEQCEQRRHARAGFTLIEILLVVVIIGMLAGIAAVSVPKNMRRAREAKAAADISAISMAIQTYYMDKGKYPSSLDLLVQGEEPYLEKGVPDDPWQNKYQYAYPGSHKPLKFDLYCYGEDGVQSGDDIANWQNQGTSQQKP